MSFFFLPSARRTRSDNDGISTGREEEDAWSKSEEEEDDGR